MILAREQLYTKQWPEVLSDLSYPVFAVPLVGHGNPLALKAILEFIDETDLKMADYQEVYLDLSTPLIALMHRMMSMSHSLSKSYTPNSEVVRSSLPAKTISWLLARELIAKTNGQLSSQPDLVVVQEHQLIGLHKSELELFGHVYLFIPDVFPKESAKKLAKKLGQRITVLVWNQQAYQELSDENINVELVPPVLYQGLVKEVEEEENAPQVVIKSSGSGMPEKYWRALVGRLAKNSLSYRVCLPNQRIDSTSSFEYRDDEEAMLDLYRSLGQNTKAVVSYPSEMVMLMYEMKQRYPDVKWYCLPPRGRHELRNLEWAIEQGLVEEVIDFDNDSFGLVG